MQLRFEFEEVSVVKYWSSALLLYCKIKKEMDAKDFCQSCLCAGLTDNEAERQCTGDGTSLTGLFGGRRECQAQIWIVF